jgi:hypothetical protein
MANALVIGAQGVLGSFVVHELRRAGWDVLRAGRRPDDAKDFRFIDLDDPRTWRPTVDEAQFIISTVPHNELPLERYVLDKGGILLSPATVSRLTLQKLDSYQRAAKGVVIPHAGLTPGLSNLLAVDLLKRVPQASDIAIGLTFKGLGASGEEGRKWVFSLFAKADRSAARQLHFPSPLNARWCLSTNLAAEGWLSDANQPPVQRLEFCMIEKALHALLKGLRSVHLMTPASRVMAPDHRHRTPQPTDEQVYQWATIRASDGREHGWLISARGDYRSTAIAVRLFAESAMRLDAESRLPRGLVRLQDMFTLDEAKAQFSGSGISVQVWNGSDKRDRT